MSREIFLHLLILCGIWSQGIIGTFADEEIEDSSDFLDRQKRVVSYLPGEDVPVRIEHASYVVRITELVRSKCVGSILSMNMVITSTRCASLGPEDYRVVSGSSYTHHGNFHDVREIRRQLENPQHRSLDGVALFIISPQFVYSRSCQPISLHTGPVQVGSLGKISGWGYNFRNANNRGTSIPKKLRSIAVPIISHQDCVNRYRPHLEISEKCVCTYHPEKHSGHLDGGAGLVVDDRLAGVFLWSGLISQTNPQYPDVFANLHDPYYNEWIRTNLHA